MIPYDRGIVILGFMGAGKTTVGRALAERLGRDFIDLDEFIVERQARPITEIIDWDGESRFREIEAASLREVIGANRSGVVALGGGTWTIPENRSVIRSAGCVSIWLDIPFELCWERIAGSLELRPLAREIAEARRRFESRRSDYALADIQVAETFDSPVETVDEILRMIGEVDEEASRT